MVRYLGPRLRIVKRLGVLPGLTVKQLGKRKKTPGQHGKVIFVKKFRSALTNDYKERLLEKQKLRFNYGLTDKQLFTYYKIGKKSAGDTGTILLQLIESRLDCILYRLGFATTISEARQIITHGHILINDKLTNMPGFLCQVGDIIKNKEQSKEFIFRNYKKQQNRQELLNNRTTLLSTVKSQRKSLLPQHLELNINDLSGKILSVVSKRDILININTSKIVQYYSL